MELWTDLLKKIIKTGEKRSDRTGVGTLSLFGERVEWDLANGFPAVTKKKLFFESVKGELAAFLRGSSSLKEFHNFDCRIWDANCAAEYWQSNPHCQSEDDLGRIYGVQWRTWQRPDGTTFDQLTHAINTIRFNPTDRRIIISSWNPGELEMMSLPPCHLTFQFYVNGADMEQLNLMVHMRSVDMFLGFAFDLASFALLLSLVANEVGKIPRRLIITMGDAHIYLNHLKQVELLLSREALPSPKLLLNIPQGFKTTDFKPGHAELINYQSHSYIKAPMAI